MGRKISVDSASLMNKGLEVIEARWLFNTPAEQIKVVVHPQSVIHSMVRYHDGSIMAQLGSPDMRTPIAYAMAWPQRIAAPVQALDFLTLGSLTFEAPDLQRFPCLRLAFDSLRTGGGCLGRAECGQRSGRCQLSRRSHRLPADSATDRAPRCRRWIWRSVRILIACWPKMPPRGRW